MKDLAFLLSKRWPAVCRSLPQKEVLCLKIIAHAGILVNPDEHEKIADYMQKIAPTGSPFNDLSHNDILWDKVKEVKKLECGEIEVFDLSIPKYEKFLCNNILVHNTRELNLPRENWLPSVVREATGLEKVGEVKEKTE